MHDISLCRTILREEREEPTKASLITTSYLRHHMPQLVGVLKSKLDALSALISLQCIFTVCLTGNKS